MSRAADGDKVSPDFPPHPRSYLCILPGSDVVLNSPSVKNRQWNNLLIIKRLSSVWDSCMRSNGGGFIVVKWLRWLFGGCRLPMGTDVSQRTRVTYTSGTFCIVSVSGFYKWIEEVSTRFCCGGLRMWRVFWLFVKYMLCSYKQVSFSSAHFTALWNFKLSTMLKTKLFSPSF